MRRFLIPMGAMVLCLLGAACVPSNPTTPTPQTPGTIHLEGDSVTFQTYWGTNVQPWYNTASYEIGASADHNRSGYPAVQRVPDMVERGNVDILIWALGLNEIFRDPGHHFSPKDQGIWLDILMNVVPEESCIVMVKPWVLPQGNDVRPLQSMNQLRAWVDALDAIRPNTVVVDWKPVLEANPHFSPGDGAHIAAGSGGAEARDAMYRAGVDDCE